MFAVQPSATGDISLKDGATSNTRAGQAFELLAHNRLGETCLATPAISEGTVFFRTRSHLLAVTG